MADSAAPLSGPDADPRLREPGRCARPPRLRAFDPDADRLAVRRDGDLVVVELADHDRRNMMGLEMTAAWGRLMAEIAADSDVRAVLVTGQGTAFSSGGNTSWIGADSHEPVSVLRERMLAYYAHLADDPRPADADDRRHQRTGDRSGCCPGAGLRRALGREPRPACRCPSCAWACTRGCCPPTCSPRWPAWPPHATCSSPVAASGPTRCSALGLVSRVVPDEELAAEALAGAHGVAAGAPVAVRLTKVALRDGGPKELGQTPPSGRAWRRRSRLPRTTSSRAWPRCARSARRGSPAAERQPSGCACGSPLGGTLGDASGAVLEAPPAVPPVAARACRWTSVGATRTCTRMRYRTCPNRRVARSLRRVAQVSFPPHNPQRITAGQRLVRRSVHRCCPQVSHGSSTSTRGHCPQVHPQLIHRRVTGGY